MILRPANDAAANTAESRAESRDTDDPITQRSKCKQSLKFATYNVRSLGNKFSSVSEFITDNDLDLAAVTETWHLSQDDVSVRRSIPPGYHIVQGRLSPLSGGSQPPSTPHPDGPRIHALYLSHVGVSEREEMIKAPR